MTQYTATITHSSLARAPEIHIGGSLAAAKRAATARFGDGFLDHVIQISTVGGETLSTRRIGDKRWQDR